MFSLPPIPDSRLRHYVYISCLSLNCWNDYLSQYSVPIMSLHTPPFPIAQTIHLSLNAEGFQGSEDQCGTGHTNGKLWTLFFARKLELVVLRLSYYAFTCFGGDKRGRYADVNCSDNY